MISLKVCRCSSTSPPGNPGAIIESIQHYLRQEGSSADNPLQRCQRVKVLRLGVLWAEELNLPWAAAARKAGAEVRTYGIGVGEWRAANHTLTPGGAVVELETPAGVAKVTSRLAGEVLILKP